MLPRKRIATHPGEILRQEFLVPLNISVNALELLLHVLATRMHIVHGKRAITADTALRLARVFNTTPEFWTTLQAAHDLSKAQASTGKQIAAQIKKPIVRNVSA